MADDRAYRGGNHPPACTCAACTRSRSSGGRPGQDGFVRRFFSGRGRTILLAVLLVVAITVTIVVTVTQ